MRDGGSDQYTCDARQLTPQQWTALRKSIVGRAQEERNRAFRQIATGVLGLAIRFSSFAVWTGSVLRKAWRRLLRRQRYLRELSELAAMDDLGLKDIGVSRLEIHAAMQSNARRPFRRRC